MPKAIVIRHVAVPQHPLTDAGLRGALPPGVEFERFDIEPEMRTLDRFDQSYDWCAAAREQESRYQELLELHHDNPDWPIYYFGFVPIPLAFHLGACLGQAIDVQIFQHHHRNGNWCWPSNLPTRPLLSAPAHPRIRGSFEGDLLIRVSLSYTIEPTLTVGLSDAPTHEYDLLAEVSDPDALNSPADLGDVGVAFRRALDHGLKLGNVRVRHVVAAVTVGAALMMGKQVNRSMHLPIQTWQFQSGRARRYVRTLRIGEFVDRPRVLLLAASPLDSAPISTPAEIQDLGDTLQRHSNRIALISRPAARIEDLLVLLDEENPTMVHIAAHGRDKSAALILQTAEGSSFTVPADELARVLARSPRLRCVVLTTCHGAELAERIARPGRIAVGVEGTLDDGHARSFACGFWASICAGHNVREAFRDGLLSVESEQARERFQMFPDEHDSGANFVLVHE